MKSRILLLVALAILPLGWLASRHSPQPDPPAATPVIAASAPTVPTSTPALAAHASPPISENQPAPPPPPRPPSSRPAPPPPLHPPPRSLPTRPLRFLRPTPPLIFWRVS